MTTERVPWTALTALAAALFLALAAGVLAGAWTDIDAHLRDGAVMPSEPLWVQVVALAGSGDVMVPLALAGAAVLWWRGHRGDAVAAALAMIATGLLVVALKAAVGRDRPVGADAMTGAFPSGHAAMAAIGVLVLHGLIVTRLRPGWRRWTGGAGVALVVAVAWARIALGEHWPTDVVASWALAVTVFGATLVIRSRVNATRSGRGPPSRSDPGPRPR